MPLKHQFRLVAAAISLCLLAACSSPELPGGLSDTATASTATTSADLGISPGFLTATPPNGGGGNQVTPPAGGLVTSGSVTPIAAPTATVMPTTPVAPTATGSPGTASSAASPKASPTATPYQTATAQATDTPVPVASAVQANVIQVDMPVPAAVSPGKTATVQATTTVPGAVCTLTVRYRTGGTPIPQFPAETADANGAVAWSWPVAPDVVPGDWPVSVRCQVGLPLNAPNLKFAFANNLLSVH